MVNYVVIAVVVVIMIILIIIIAIAASSKPAPPPDLSEVEVPVFQARSDERTKYDRLVKA